MRKLSLRAAIVTGVAVLAVVFASSAFAAGNEATKITYTGAGTKIQKSLGTSKVTKKPKRATHVKKPLKTAVTGTTTLPFTGLDLVFVVGAGVLLVGTGLGLRRLTRKPLA